MTMTPIEDVISAAERQAEIDWDLEHRAPQPCEHQSVIEERMMLGPVRCFCADCGKVMP